MGELGEDFVASAAEFAAAGEGIEGRVGGLQDKVATADGAVGGVVVDGGAVVLAIGSEAIRDEVDVLPPGEEAEAFAALAEGIGVGAVREQLEVSPAGGQVAVLENLVAERGDGVEESEAGEGGLATTSAST